MTSKDQSEATSKDATSKKRLTAEQAIAFRALQPAALALVATDGPVSMTLYDRSGAVTSRIGHNRGVWPARVARTGAWKDTVTATYDKSPLVFTGVQFRLWFATEQERDRVADGVVSLIAERADSDGGIEQLRHDFQDLGPDLDLDLFQLEVTGIAGRAGATWWDDDGLPLWLDRVMAQVRRWQGPKRLTDRELTDMIDRAALRELGR